jgi:hypothetical protein
MEICISQDGNQIKTTKEHPSPQHERIKSFATFPTPHISHRSLPSTWFKNFDKTGLCKAKEASREWQHQKEC